MVLLSQNNLFISSSGDRSSIIHYKVADYPKRLLQFRGTMDHFPLDHQDFYEDGCI